MTARGEPVFYAAVPHKEPDNQDYVLLPLYHRPDVCRGRLLLQILLFSVASALLLAVLFLLWPSDPDLQLVRLRLNHIHVNPSHKLSIDLSLSLTIKVRNRDFFSLDYSQLEASLGYRGRALGFVSSDGGHVRARGTSYINATMMLDGVEIVHDVFYLLEDLTRGMIPFDTSTKLRGDLGLLLFKIPLKAKISCDVCVDASNQKIIGQNCYPK